MKIIPVERTCLGLGSQELLVIPSSLFLMAQQIQTILEFLYHLSTLFSTYLAPWLQNPLSVPPHL